MSQIQHEGFRPEVESFESRVHPTLVFILPGNALAAVKPDVLTRIAARELAHLGDRPVQLGTPAMNSPRAFFSLAHHIRRISHGQPIGLMGFGAGGLLAMRMAGLPQLNVKAVMNFYGPPDLKTWFTSHKHDRFSRYVISHVHVTPRLVRLLSGPCPSQAYFVSAFGLLDRNVLPGPSTQSFHRDFSQGQVFYYRGPHGVSLTSDFRAFMTFADHLR